MNTRALDLPAAQAWAVIPPPPPEEMEPPAVNVEVPVPFNLHTQLVDLAGCHTGGDVPAMIVRSLMRQLDPEAAARMEAEAAARMLAAKMEGRA